MSDDGKSRKSNRKSTAGVERRGSGIEKKDSTIKEKGVSDSEQRPASEKCPSWLKMLLLFLLLVALAGLGYWFFFKRGKKQVVKITEEVKVAPHVVSSHPIPITDSKAPT